MRSAAFVLLLVACAQSAPGQGTARAVPGPDYEAAFGGRYATALEYVRQRAGSWRTRCNELGVDCRLLVPVVFPELLRVSVLRSEVESLGLSTLYVARGPGAADFSIGRFQMKPSFVEALEAAVEEPPAAPVGLLAIREFPGARDEQARRAMRCRRLRSEEWQLTYLACRRLDVLPRLPEWDFYERYWRSMSGGE